jgi:hypothetical protein
LISLGWSSTILKKTYARVDVSLKLSNQPTGNIERMRIFMMEEQLESN